MSTVCALGYSNILTASSESKTIYPLIKNKKVTYFRYIDIIFFIRKRTTSKFEKCFTQSSMIGKIQKKNSSIVSKIYKASPIQKQYIHTYIHT